MTCSIPRELSTRVQERGLELRNDRVFPDFRARQVQVLGLSNAIFSNPVLDLVRKLFNKFSSSQLKKFHSSNYKDIQLGKHCFSHHRCTPPPSPLESSPGGYRSHERARNDSDRENQRSGWSLLVAFLCWTFHYPTVQPYP